MFSKKKIVSLKVEGMSCGHCREHVKKALESISGVKADVSLEKASAEIKCPENTDTNELIKAVNDAGYKASLIG